MGATLFEFPFKLIVFFTLAAIFPFITKFVKFSLIPKKVEIFFTRLMEDAIQMRLSGGIERDDFLNFLLELQNKKNLKTVDLTAHTMTFFLDGFETSSIVIANILYQLGNNKNVQDSLRKEIHACCKHNNGHQVSYDDIQELEYLDQVFNGRYTII